MQLVMCAENGEWCMGTSYKVHSHAHTQLTGNGACYYSDSFLFDFKDFFLLSIEFPQKIALYSMIEWK
jgi:hypothetical protein